MFILKSCPKCKGDVHINRDWFGCYKQCLQCGLMEDVECRSTFKHVGSNFIKQKGPHDTDIDGLPEEGILNGSDQSPIP